MTLFEKWLDRFTERRVRRAAQLTSRRSAVAKVGAALVGSAVLPMLPFDRSGQAYAQHGGAAGGNKAEDPTACEYWRNCALDGFLCTCCGGTVTQCPPGAMASKVSWVGTCKQSEGRHRLPGELQRLLRQDRLRTLPVQLQRARAPRLPHGRVQRHQLVHGQHPDHVPLHGVGGRGRIGCLMRDLQR